MFTGLIQAVGTVAATQPTPAGRRLVIDTQAWAHTPEPGASIAVSGCCLTVVGEPTADPDTGHAHLAFDVIPETLAKTTIGRLRPGDRVNLEHAATLATYLGGHLVQGHIDTIGEVIAIDRPPAGAQTPAQTPAGQVGTPPTPASTIGQPAETPPAGPAHTSTDTPADPWLPAAQHRIRLRPPAELLAFLIPKGSITIDGVSLTIAELDPGSTGHARSPDPADPADRPGEPDTPAKPTPPGGWFEVALIPETLERTTLADLQPGDRVNLEADAMAKTVVHYLRHFTAAPPTRV